MREDESLEDVANLPDPNVIAVEIAEDLQSALDQFSLTHLTSSDFSDR